MLSYTFTNGECPITYVTKLCIHPDIAGDTIHDFPEMKYYLTPYNSTLYFKYNTIIYLTVLFHVARRSHVIHKLYTLTFVLSIYFLFILTTIKKLNIK
jgi:cytochrome c oxidase assembly factor CtaG